MMDEEAVWLVPVFTVAAQHGAHGLCLLARVGKDQALAAARMLKDIAHTGVGVFGRRVGGVEKRLLGRTWDVDFALGGRGSATVFGSGLAPRLLTTLMVFFLCKLSAVAHVLSGCGQRRGRRRLNTLASKHFGLLRTCALESSLLRLGTRVVEVLHGDTPHAARLLKTGDNAIASRSL